MINTKRVYECVDERKGVPVTVDGIVLLVSIPGGFEVRSANGIAEQFLFEDDDQLEDLDVVSTFYMPEGKVYFTELTLPDFERFEGQSIFSTPKFKTTEELQSWFRETINAIWYLD